MPKTARRIGRPLGADSQETRTRIIAAAREKFALIGYANATNAMIAEECGVTAGTIYHHFGGKQKLYEAVAEASAALVLEEIEASGDPSLGFIENLKRAIAATAKSNVRYPFLANFAIAIETEAAQNPELAEVDRAFHESIQQYYDRLVAEAIESKTIRSDITPEALNDLIRVIRQAAALLAIRSGSDTARYRHALAAIEALLDGDLVI